jgi:translocator protein
VSGTVAFMVAGIGGGLTDLGLWYQNLRFPDWKPPDAAFPIAWTAIFALIAVAATIGWVRSPDRRTRTVLLGLLALNAALNIGWSTLFFAFHRPDWAILEVGFLWLSIAMLALHLRPHAPVAAWCLAPYLVWVAFAAALNASVVALNAPFPGRFG